jgi:replication fork protection complex subunit Tof1/Swi1
LLKGVDVHKIFLNETELEAKHASDLHDLMGREASMIKGYTNGGPSRHNRFGTMIWVQRDEERVSAVSGQDVLTDEQHALQKMDFSKKWNKPKRNLKGDNTSNSFDLPIPLTNSATKHLRSFVEEFLDSGFNPLFSHRTRG